MRWRLGILSIFFVLAFIFTFICIFIFLDLIF
jgi:hypothetical protein